MAYSCDDCSYLDKTRKAEASNNISFRYGCNNKESTKGFICGWIIKDRNENGQLSTMGCSDWTSQEQISLF